MTEPINIGGILLIYPWWNPAFQRSTCRYRYRNSCKIAKTIKMSIVFPE